MHYAARIPSTISIITCIRRSHTHVPAARLFPESEAIRPEISMISCHANRWYWDTGVDSYIVATIVNSMPFQTVGSRQHLRTADLKGCGGCFGGSLQFMVFPAFQAFGPVSLAASSTDPCNPDNHPGQEEVSALCCEKSYSGYAVIPYCWA